MNVPRTLFLLLVPLLLATASWAQEASRDDVLQRYALATENLDAAVAALPQDASEARAALDQAFSALLTLARGGNAALTESLDRVFERARVAIDNRSATDLAVQAEVLRGGFQRLLYEAALTAAVEGDDALARERLLRLADDVGLGTARAEGLQATAEVGALRRTFEAGVAEQTAARLDALAAAGLEDPDAAYRGFADAYADYLLVQDSPRLGEDANRLFVEAANAIVDDEPELFAERLAAVADQLEGLRDAADAGAADAVSDTAEVLEGAPAGAPAEATPAEEPADAEAAPAPAEAAELPLQDDAAAEDAAAGEEEAADPAPPAEDAREAVLAEQRAARRAALVDELGAFGLLEEDRGPLADALLAADIGSVDDAETDLAALASRVSAAVLRGEQDAARARLDELGAYYTAALAPVAAQAAPEADADFVAFLDRLEAAPALRAEDAALLASQLDALSARLRGGSVPASHEAIAAASSWWAGWIRPAAMIALALLALVPLRLLDLAFGGGNRNWRLVGTALFLLLLPVMYEGVAAAGALLAGPTGVPALRELSAWSVFANDLTQLVWAALVAIALLLAAAGFYGICVQFGVLGRGRRREARAAEQPKNAEDTLVDWDDDF